MQEHVSLHLRWDIGIMPLLSVLFFYYIINCHFILAIATVGIVYHYFCHYNNNSADCWRRHNNRKQISVKFNLMCVYSVKVLSPHGEKPGDMSDMNSSKLVCSQSPENLLNLLSCLKSHKLSWKGWCSWLLCCSWACGVCSVSYLECHLS